MACRDLTLLSKGYDVWDRVVVTNWSVVDCSWSWLLQAWRGWVAHIRRGACTEIHGKRNTIPTGEPAMSDQWF